LIYLDLDGFKQVNDHHGHASGDCVLREVATVLTEMARASDLPARIGGDEFVVLLAGREVDTAAAAHRYCQRIEATMKRNGWSVTASIGAVSFPVAPADVEEALCAADALMYNAKASGKNRVLHQEFTDRQIAPGARRACV
jgi:diguanylate cyclase (GGDEF)-like protein